MIRFIFAFFALLMVTGCSRSNETWEDVKTAGRYMQKGVDSLLGKEYESRMLSSEGDFYGPNDDAFIPLRDSDLRMAGVDNALPQPKGIPGQNGIPPLSSFHGAPANLANLFRNVHFSTDEHVVKDKAELSALMNLATYLKQNPNVYLMIEGHCDERASASYNQALGLRRANFVRTFLINHGADLNRIYTVSRGKEQPVAQGHSDQAWSQNRRSEFRMVTR